MEEVNLTETESRYFGDLFLCCETDKSNKVPILKATEMFRSANLSNDVLRQITCLAGIPQTAIHMSRAQFYACLKLIAAHQAAVPLREELISSLIQLPLPKFSWKDTNDISSSSSLSSSLAGTSSSLAAANCVNKATTIAAGEKRNDLSSHWRQPALDMNKDHHHNHHHHHHQQQQPAHHHQGDTCNSDFPSTDSEIEHNDIDMQDRAHRHKRSPEAWSTASDSPTPTNSVAERSWTKNNLWDGLLCEEQRELLGTEEESSDRHSSEDDDGDPVLEVLETPEMLESLYKITPEQRTYYINQFKTVQPDMNGLISGQVAKVFFEKSRIPVKELRHIWQLCDITRDGALNLNEFIGAMHLIVLRRNCIPVPSVLPALLKASIPLGPVIDPPEADLLHLDDDRTITSAVAAAAVATVATNNQSDYKRMTSGSEMSDGPVYKSHSSVSSLSNMSGQKPNSPVKIISNPPPPQRKIVGASATVAVAVNSSPQSSGTSPPLTAANVPEHMSPVRIKETEWSNQSKEWTKFTESPTSNLSSPGPKPANFDMQRTAQAVGSDPQILHPVPLRVTPSGVEAIDENSMSSSMHGVDFNKKPADGAAGGAGLYDGTATGSSSGSSSIRGNEYESTGCATGKQLGQFRENDLRAIQRPQSKKLPAKNVGGLPPPPQREPSIGSVECGPISIGNDLNSSVSSGVLGLGSKKDPQPPPPPPRPHKHARSSSLDLNKFKLNEELRTEESLPNTLESNCSTATGSIINQTAQVPRNSLTASTGGSFQDSLPLTGVNQQNSGGGSGTTTVAINQHSSNLAVVAAGSTVASACHTPPRHTIHIVQTTTSRSSAFEVYRKPASTSFYSPETITAAESDHLVTAITDSLKNTKFKQEKNLIEIMHQLKEQNALLLRLCYDLNEELKSVKQKKEEIISQLEASSSHHHSTV